VLALRESDPDTAFREDFSDGIVLVSELGAQLGALRETGVLAGERCVALFDVGASGTSVSVVDVESGRVLASHRTEELRGDECDRVLSDHLIETFGAAEALTVARRQLVHDVQDGKHQLSILRSVSVVGPFVGGRASLWRHDLDELIGDAVRAAVFTAVDVLQSVAASGVHVEAIVAVGGGANMQIVRQTLFDAVSVPVYVPERPELLAARGAAGIARTVGARPAPAPAVTAVTAVPSRRPRHSGSPSRRMARAAKSRRVGGALAALVAVCVAGTVVAAAARTTDDTPEPSIATSQNASPSARSQAVMPAVDGSPSVSTPPSVSATDGAASSSTSPTSGVSTSSPAPTSPNSGESPPASHTISDVTVLRPAREGTRVPTTTTAPTATTAPAPTTTTAPTHPTTTTAPSTTAPTTTTVPHTTTRASTPTKPTITTPRRP
jgi:hypothetical protein